MLPVVSLVALAVAAPIPEARPEGLVVWSVPFGRPPAPPLFAATAGVWAPDGKHVLTAGWVRSAPDADPRGVVRVWDAATGKYLRSHLGAARSYGARAGHLAISPDGKTVVCGGTAGAGGAGAEYAVEVWDRGAERSKARLGYDRAVAATVFSPDGRTLTAADMTGKLAAWDTRTWRPKWRSAIRPEEWVVGLAHHPSRPVLALTDTGGGVRVLDAASGNPLPVLPRRPTGGAFSAAFAPDGRTLAVGGIHSADDALGVARVQVDDAAVSLGEFRRANRWPGRAPAQCCVYQVAFSPDGSLLAAACSDGTVRLFDPATAVNVAFAWEHTDFVYSVVFSPDGRRLLSVGRDAVRVWSVAELRNRRPTP